MPASRIFWLLWFDVSMSLSAEITKLQLGFLSRLGGCQGEKTKQCRMYLALLAARASHGTPLPSPPNTAPPADTLAGKFGTAFLLLVAQEMMQNDGSSASHKAFLPSPFHKTQAQGVKTRMNTEPRCIATTKKPSQKQGKKPTQARQMLLSQSKRLGTTHIYVMIGKKIGCLRRSLPARYASLTPSHPSCPLSPRMEMALSILPPVPPLPTVVWGNESGTRQVLPLSRLHGGWAVWDTAWGPLSVTHWVGGNMCNTTLRFTDNLLHSPTVGPAA